MRIHKRASKVLVIATAALMVVGSFAFFTDRVTANATANAGTLDLVLNSTTKSHSDTLKPGEAVKVSIALENKGNKSADIRETFVITSEQVLTKANAEFKLYSIDDVDFDGKTASVKTGKAALAVSEWSTDNTKMTIKVPGEFILDGAGADAETETDSKGVSTTREYVLVFGNNADNDFIDKDVTVDYLAEAKQHRNTGEDTWTSLAVEEISFAGNSAYEVVKGLN